MRLALRGALGLLASAAWVAAQTYTECNPLQRSCPADPALGKVNQVFDFTKGASSEFTPLGTVTYDPANGAVFTIAQQGQAPLIQSNWYIMFGRVEYVIKAAPGTGIVSSAVLQSDDLDEVDWEWLGVNDAQVQTNYFGKGDTSSYNRGAFHSNPGNHDSFHTYAIDWTSNQIVWSIDGETARVLTPETADTNQYPQTPMMVKVGVWAGGDPNNAKGTIDWAGGLTDYSQGPFTMYLKSMTVTDYSTGSSYSYSDMSGSWQSIRSLGGQVNGNSVAEPKSTEAAPSVTATAASIPVPWSGTHMETSSYSTPDVWPWVATGSPAASSTGFPKGWTSGSQQVQPPGGRSSSFRSSSLPLASSSAAFSRSGIETSRRNVTRTAMTTTTSATTASGVGETSTLTAGASITTNGFPSATVHAAPSVKNAGSLYQASVIVGGFSAFLACTFALL